MGRKIGSIGSVRLVLGAMMLAVIFAGSVGAQTDTAYVPFVVNVHAYIEATRGKGWALMYVVADKEKILAVPLGGANSVWNTGAARGRLNAPVISGSRGNITLRLPAQSYQCAEISLHAVNGRRILRGKAAASEATSAISRRNVAAGVYLLSVKGIDGSAFTTRLTHSGGSVNINVAFGGSESVSPDRLLAKLAAEEVWTITVSALADGYNSHTYQLNLVSGDNDRQDINLRRTTASGETFVDDRDQKTYRKVTIGSQTWMAENLNYEAENSVCYENSADSCAKYGRLYNWATAMGGAKSSSLNPSGVQGVCPAGWHLPSYDEWTMLNDSVFNASKKLKSTSGWNSNGNGTDEYGFSALPGGYGNSGGNFNGAGYYGNWWSATEDDASNALSRGVGYNYVKSMYSMNPGKTTSLFSVRCLQD